MPKLTKRFLRAAAFEVRWDAIKADWTNQMESADILVKEMLRVVNPEGRAHGQNVNAVVHHDPEQRSSPEDFSPMANQNRNADPAAHVANPSPISERAALVTFLNTVPIGDDVGADTTYTQLAHVTNLEG